MTGWQPIETAPKDGTEVDLWMVNERGDGWREADARWVTGYPVDDLRSKETRDGWYGPNHGYDGEFGWADEPKVEGRPYFTEPTHWMPVPSPPEGSQHLSI